MYWSRVWLGSSSNLQTILGIGIGIGKQFLALLSQDLFSFFIEFEKFDVYHCTCSLHSRVFC